jgi:hypothetical protein
MALTTEAYGPTERNPDASLNEWQVARLVGNGTASVVAAGAGVVGAVYNNFPVAGSFSLHDAVTGATLNATNRILFIDTTTVGLKSSEPIVFSSGLQVVTPSASNEVTFNFRGRATLNPRQFGVA